MREICTFGSVRGGGGNIPAYSAPTRKLVLAYPADRPVSPAARFVGDVFLEIATDLVDRNIWVGHMLAQDCK